MKILLVTMTDNLAEKLAALNPELEFCAAVVDNVEVAKEIFANVGLPQFPVYQMKQLKKRVGTVEYDYVLLVQEKFYGMKIVRSLQSLGLPTEKLVGFATLPNAGNWQTERHIRYFREHAQDFEMFAICRSMWGA